MTNQPSSVASLVPASQVLLSSESCRIAVPGDATETKGPRIEMIREGGTLRGVTVVCGCGERMRLTFEVGG